MHGSISVYGNIEMRNYQYSIQGQALTEKFEGERFAAYWDALGKLWTIGFGHTKGVVSGMTSTHQQNVNWLLDDIAGAVKNVNQHLEVDVSQGLFDALVDFDFNCGDGNLNTSTLLKLVNENQIQEAILEFDKWDHAGGKVVAGLLARRQAETDEAQNG